MLTVNLFGSPGAGKSTMSAKLFAYFKEKNINCELVSEYAKIQAWLGTKANLNNQLYVFAKQHHKHFMLNNKVDILFTDSPLIISTVYGDKDIYLDNLIWSEFDKENNFNILLKRSKPYNPSGRFQDESESNLIQDRIRKMLDTNRVHYFYTTSSVASFNLIVEQIYKKLEV